MNLKQRHNHFLFSCVLFSSARLINLLSNPIASGVIEGICNHLVKKRFEISAARWGLDGIESLLKMRAIYQSGSWDEYWEYHIKKEQKHLYSDKQWKLFGEKKKPPKLDIIPEGKLSK